MSNYMIVVCEDDNYSQKTLLTLNNFKALFQNINISYIFISAREKGCEQTPI